MKDKELTRKLDIFGILVLFMLLLGFYPDDSDLVKKEEASYREAVCIWENQVKQGVSKEQADGHPDYKNVGVTCGKDI